MPKSEKNTHLKQDARFRKNKKPLPEQGFFHGADSRNRTGDLILTNYKFYFLSFVAKSVFLRFYAGFEVFAFCVVS